MITIRMTRSIGNSSIALKSYTKTIIPQSGICSVMITHKDKQKAHKFLVVPDFNMPLFSVDAAKGKDHMP